MRHHGHAGTQRVLLAASDQIERRVDGTVERIRARQRALHLRRGPRGPQESVLTERTHANELVTNERPFRATQALFRATYFCYHSWFRVRSSQYSMVGN